MANLVDRNMTGTIDWSLVHTGWGGIPIYPYGEMNVFEYMVELADNVDATRKRLITVYTQWVSCIILSWVFIQNLITILFLVYRRPRNLMIWCCLMHTGPMAVWCILAFIPAGLPFAMRCRIILWGVHISFSVSSAAANALLLGKTYLVYGKRKFILVIGTFLTLLSFTNLYVVLWDGAITISSKGGCITIYPIYYMWAKLSTDVPINVLFSMAFIWVAYKQYKQFGSNCWGSLARNGMITMAVIVVSNLFCIIGSTLLLFGPLSRILLIIDCAIVSTTLIRHYKTTVNNLNQPNRPRTTNILQNGFSKIGNTISRHTNVGKKSRAVSGDT